MFRPLNAPGARSIPTMVTFGRLARLVGLRAMSDKA
jgi:hypothetical protein